MQLLTGLVTSNDEFGQSIRRRQTQDLQTILYRGLFPSSVHLVGQQRVVLQRSIPQEKWQPNDTSVCWWLYCWNSSVDSCVDSVDLYLSDPEAVLGGIRGLYLCDCTQWETLMNDYRMLFVSLYVNNCLLSQRF